MTADSPLPADGWVLFVKADCPTCRLIEPVIHRLQAGPEALMVCSQDDPAFPGGDGVVDDRSLELSYRQKIEVVPTLLRMSGGREEQRIFGWDRQQWREFTGNGDLGEDLPPFKPGCGAKNVDPGMEDILTLRFGDSGLRARQITPAEEEDLTEACYDRGWTDGLPVVPPTPLRVYRMLQGTHRAADEVLGKVPPDLATCTVEKVAINAVMAGCRPEYMPLVLAAVEAALDDAFCMHGLLCTTYFSAPVVVVNGPMAARVGMNSGLNALGQGNRANATIGRALQLLIRNLGGGRPGEVDRATLGTPGKYTFCFAEDERDESWPTLAMDRGLQREQSAVTLFAGDGIQPVMDQQSRDPASLAGSFARSLQTVAHAKLAFHADAMLVVSPEHRRVFREAGWDKEHLREELIRLTTTDGKDLVRGAGGIAEGMPAPFKDHKLPKFRPGGLHILTAGGDAGMFSAIIGGWVASGPMGSEMVTKEVKS